MLSSGEEEPRCSASYPAQLPARSRVAVTPFPVQTQMISLHDSTGHKHKTLATIGHSFSRTVSAQPYLPCHCQRQPDWYGGLYCSENKPKHQGADEWLPPTTAQAPIFIGLAISLMSCKAELTEA